MDEAANVSNFQSLLVCEPLRVFAVTLFCFGLSATLTTNLYRWEISVSFNKEQAEEKLELAKWVKSSANGRIPLFVSLSAWRLMLITNTHPDAAIQPLAALIRRDQLSRYIEEMGKEKYAVYYDLSNESYFKVEDPAFGLAFERAISTNFPETLGKNQISKQSGGADAAQSVIERLDKFGYYALPITRPLLSIQAGRLIPW
ncbi:MAG: hypothetical protein HT580_10335 [Dechloromonas sp.]|nr:MAG: hypothetical protein HT580_10335 [Dechloromonas sp.]